MIKVAIFDDSQERRECLQTIIESCEDFELVGVFEDCRNVKKDIALSLPDVVLMDIEMPGVNGIEGVKVIKSQHPEIKILMQTVFEEDDKVFASILAGASGYILKKTDMEKVIEAVKDLYEGGAPMTPVIARKVLEWMKNHSADADENFNLTEREKEILSCLVQGFSYKMIADKCFVSYHTVNTHIKKIYEKLQVHSQSEAVAKALKKRIV